MSKILLIDDNKAYCEQIKKSLELKNIPIEFETDPSKGLKLALTADWDVILIDMVLGNWLDGLTILEEIKKQKDDVPLILISGSNVTNSASEYLHAGAFDYLEKPIELERMLFTINNALNLRQLIKLNKTLINELEPSISKIGLGHTLQKAINLLSSISDKPERLLILGEHGTGKELIAKMIHFNGKRKYGPFIVHYCNDNETDPDAIKLHCYQLFKKAQHGTLFLKEIQNLSKIAQKHLARLLHQNFFGFNSDSSNHSVDVRIIASTSQDLKALIQEDAFLPELYELLANFTIKVPPLRERKGDIPALIQHFVNFESQNVGIFIQHISPEAIELLLQQDWPGNTAQLKHVVRLMVLHNNNGKIDATVAKLAIKINQLLTGLKNEDHHQELKNLFNDILQLKKQTTVNSI